MCSSNALYDSPKLHAMSSKNLPDKDRSYENSFLDDFLNQLYQALYLWSVKQIYCYYSIEYNRNEVYN